MRTNEETQPPLKQGSLLLQLQTTITAIQAETAATVEDLVLTQADNILGASELIELQADIQTKRQKLIMLQIGVVLRKMEER